MRQPAELATRYAGRPILMTSTAAQSYAERLRAMDPHAFDRPNRFQAVLRRIGLAGDRPRAPLADRAPVGAWDDDDYTPPPPFEERLAYAPRWLGEPEDVGFCWTLNQGVALMECDTPLVERGDEWCGMVWHGYDTLLMAMKEAAADARVKAIFLRLDSPGGVVGGGLPALAAWMRENRGSAGGKPIWIYADMACSAAYWIAAQSDRILAPAVGLVGSIGAVIVHVSEAKALAKEGIEVTPIQFGERKTDGAWWKALDERTKDALQADVDQCGRDFIADVVAGRPQLTEEALLATEADAYMARHDLAERSGLAIGFVDAIASEEEAFALLVAEISTPDIQTSPAAPVSGSAPAANKETDMKRSTVLAALGRAGFSAQALARASAELESAEAAEAEDPNPDDEDEDEEKDDKSAAETSPDDEDKKDDDEKDDKEGDKGAGGAGQTEAQRIAGSKEAKTFPHLANAAIASGQTYEQFKATAEAQAAAPKGKGVLGQAMAGARRLGPDASASATGGAGRQPSALVRRAEERRKSGAA